MLLFKALNTGSGDGPGPGDSEPAAPPPPRSPTQTKKVEAEPDIEHTFRTALTFLGNEGEEERAGDLLGEILKSPQLKSKNISPKDMKLKYACLKNLVIIHEKVGRFQDAVDCGVQAMQIDADEIPLVFRVGRLAQRVTCFDLALHAFRSVLDLRPTHWPSLDALLRLTYAMCRFEECLPLCASGLRRDRHYRAAMFCLREMLTMQPSLGNRLDREILDITEDERLRKNVENDAKFCADMQDFAEKIRQQIREKAESLRPQPLPFLTFEQPLEQPRWSTLLQAFRDKYYQLLESGGMHMTVDVRTLLARKDEVKAEPESEALKDELEVASDERESAEVTPAPTASPSRPCTPEPNVVISETKKLSPVDQIAKMVRQGVDETLVEKRRSSRACVVSAWGANESRSSARNRNDSANDSVVCLLNCLLFEELWDWAEKVSDAVNESAEATEGTATSSCDGTGKDCHVHSVDEDCEQEVLDFLESLSTSSLMHHSRKLLLTLAEKFDRRWPRSMVKNYMALFEPVFGLNFQHEKDVPSEERMRFIRAYLLALEFQADRTQTDLQAKNRVLYRHEEAYSRFPHLLMVHQWLLREPQESKASKQALLRIRWLDYVWQILCGDRLMAERTLNDVNQFLEEGLEHLNRPNCVNTPFIDSDVVTRTLGALNKRVGVERLRALSVERRYEDLLNAWKEDAALQSSAELSVVLCEMRLLVHRALAHTERWEEGLRHGIRSVHLVRFLLHDPEGLENCGLDPKLLLKFSWRSLRITAVCWEAMSDDERSHCCPSDLSRLVIGSCKLIQDMALGGHRLVTEDAWILLHEILVQLQKVNPNLCRSTAMNRKEDVDLPPSLTCLFIGHEYLAANRCCGRSHGRLLRHILHAVGKPGRARSEAYCGDADDREFLFLQAVKCLHGITRRSKSRPVDDHHTQQLPLKDYATMQLIYAHFRPDSVAEFDSVRSLSISADTVAMTKIIMEHLPRYEDRFGLSETALEELITGGADNFRHFMTHWKEDSKDLISKNIYYLLADYHFKSRAVDDAVKLYRRDLRFNPLRFDSWAALSLARLSLVQKGLDQQDYSEMQNLIKEVNICMRGFDCVLMLNNKCSKLMVENGTLAYEIYSYADKYYRQWKLRGSCPSIPLLTACCEWRKEMLSVAERRFREAIDCGPEDEQELWYYYYMRGKCAEKTNRPLFDDVMKHYHKSLSLLHSSGARYPRRIFFYGTLPSLSLETIEVFYRCHAALFKRLLFWSKRLEECEELDIIEAELLNHAKSDFAMADRIKTGQKRGRHKGTVAAAAPAPSNVPAGQRRSKRARFETEESAPTSEAEGELELTESHPEASPFTGQTAAQAAATEAVETVLEAVYLQVDVEECLEEMITQTVAAVGPDPIAVEDRKDLQWRRCLGLCLDAFELLVQRCPHHYKSVRKVSRICLCLSPTRNVPKAVEYLWSGGINDGGKTTVCALFKDRKGNNLFNGIYRNPIHDLDRCGNFSHHMRGCVELLLRALRERCDWISLKEVCLTLLASIPEVKNVCVTAQELEMLQKKAFVFCLRSIEQQLLRPETIEWPLLTETWLGRPRLTALPLFRLYRVYRTAVRSFPEFKTEAFKYMALTFFRTGMQVREKVPVIDQIRTFLRVDT